VALAVAAFVLGTIIVEFRRGVRARRHLIGEAPATALVNLVAKNNRRYGGYIIHIGVIVAFVGIVGSAFFKTEVKKTVSEGQSFAVGPYRLRYLGVVPTNTPHLESATANLLVTRDGREVAQMAPAKLFFKRQQQPATKVAIRSTPFADLYVVLAGLDDSGNQATFEVFLTPLVFWLWAGGLLMVLGTVVVMWPNVRERAAIAQALRGAADSDLVGEPAPGGE